MTVHTNLYHWNHRLVGKIRGPARMLKCQRCGGSAEDWATVRGLDSENERIDPLTGFIPLCKKCHRVYDEVAFTGWVGRRHSGETKEKLRQIKTGVSNHTPESRRKISEAMQGRTFSDETRERMRQAQLGKKMGLRARERMSAAQRLRFGLEPGEYRSHGTTGYRKGCRCDECRAAHARAAADYKSRKGGTA
jgi:hypothetical protein